MPDASANIALSTFVPLLRYARCMSGTIQSGAAPDVPAQVFEKFLADLATAGLPPDLITRLRTTLIDERAFSDRALKAAILAEGPLP